MATSGTLSFDHIHLVSRNSAAAADWYVEKLDGRITAKTEVRGAPQIMVSFGGATVIIRGERSGETATSREGLQWGIDHFGFQVSGDFDRYCGELKAKGVEFTVDPMDFGATLRIAFIRAPDDVIIELLQRKG